MGLRMPTYEYYKNEEGTLIPSESVGKEAIERIKARKVGITALEIMNS